MKPEGRTANQEEETIVGQTTKVRLLVSREPVWVSEDPRSP